MRRGRRKRERERERDFLTWNIGKEWENVS
jgi:hypothetical protein